MSLFGGREMPHNIRGGDKTARYPTGSDEVGVASVADTNRHAPPGHRPDDILLGARSVIVFAGHMTLRWAWPSSSTKVLWHEENSAISPTRK